MSANLLNRSTINGIFRRALETEEDSLGTKQVALFVSSEVALETYGIGSTPDMPAQKRGGQTNIKPFSGVTFDVKNLPFDTGVDIPREAAERDQTGHWQAQVAWLGQRFAQHPASLMDGLIESNPAVYDGESMFSASHQFGGSPIQSNLLTDSDVGSLAVAAASNIPTPEEAAEILVGLYGHMLGFRDDSNQPLNDSARRFGIFAPAEMVPPLRTAINANNLADGRTNPVQGMKADGFSFSLFPRSRFAASNVIYMFRMDHPGLKPFVVQQEVAPRIDFFGPDSEYARLHDHFLAKGYYRGNVGAAEPLMMVKATTS